jgi:hypothetical protein
VHELEVAFGILLVAEDSPGNHVGGIVNAAYQAEARSSALEPVVRAGINLEKHALLGVAVAALVLGLTQSYLLSVGNIATASAWLCMFLLVALTRTSDRPTQRD